MEGEALLNPSGVDASLDDDMIDAALEAVEAREVVGDAGLDDSSLSPVEPED